MFDQIITYYRSIINYIRPKIELVILADDYYNLLILLIFAVLLSCILFIASFILGRRKPDKEKISAYECGFSPFEDARQKFDVRFYLVAILFIVFDLEVAYLFP